jgi:hypothetical protein
MTKVLTGKIALVTGGSRGIGAAIVRELAAQGATVALSYSASKTKADEVVAKIEEPVERSHRRMAGRRDRARPLRPAGGDCRSGGVHREPGGKLRDRRRHTSRRQFQRLKPERLPSWTIHQPPRRVDGPSLGRGCVSQLSTRTSVS